MDHAPAGTHQSHAVGEWLLPHCRLVAHHRIELVLEAHFRRGMDQPGASMRNSVHARLLSVRWLGEPVTVP